MAKDNNSDMVLGLDAKQLAEKVMKFLGLFLCKTLVKRISSLILIAADVPNVRITELTGLCDRSVRSLKKAVGTGDIDGLFSVGGGGRKPKLAKDVEESIVEEIENNNYHSRQQIADMILEKYNIKVSLPAVGRLLKKRHQASKERFLASKG